jgi:mono/diheme cytochrome c family protein
MKSGILGSLFFAILAYSLAVLAEDGPGSGAAYYRVEDGRVDAQTLLGWRFYHFTCVSCHGADATGTDLAPDLTQSVKTLGPHDFEVKVLNRYLIAVPVEDSASESGSAVRQAFVEELAKEAGAGTQMPHWDKNPAVRERISALYAYLRARADGALGPGRPELLK